MFTIAEPTTSLDVANSQELVLDLTGPNPYTVGGEAFTPEDLPLRVKNRIDSVEGRSQSGDYWLLYDKANDKLQAFVAATGVEAAAIDLSAETFTARILGR